MNWHLFFLLIAWPTFVVSTIVAGLSILFTVQYEGSVDQALDRVCNMRRAWPILPSSSIALISLAWIIAS